MAVADISSTMNGAAGNAAPAAPADSGNGRSALRGGGGV